VRPSLVIAEYFICIPSQPSVPTLEVLEGICLSGIARPFATGSVITYLRRYTSCALLGVTGDEDDDASAADGHSIALQASPASNGHTPPANHVKVSFPLVGNQLDLIW
jgi:hypothetical protein